MTRGIFETALGAFVLFVAVGFAVFVYSAREDDIGSTYDLSMRFNSVQGLKDSAEVRLGGVQVGTVTGLQLDGVTLEAVVDIEINESVRLPADSTAEIKASGLLGGNFLNLLPGSSAELLAEGAEITHTKDPVSLEDLLGQAIFALSKK